MAIQNRRGLKKDFDPNKLLPAEYGIPTDTKEVYVAFAPGDVKRMVTEEELTELKHQAADIVTQVNQATDRADQATERANYASEQVENIVANKVGINDVNPTNTQAYSGVKTESRLSTKAQYGDVDTQSGTSVQSKIADDSLIELKIEGATTVTPTNPDLDISPDNVATIVNAGNFEVVACGKNLLPNNGTSRTSDGISYLVNSDKSVTINGTSTKDYNVFYFCEGSNNGIFEVGKTYSIIPSVTTKSILYIEIVLVHDDGKRSYLQQSMTINKEVISYKFMIVIRINQPISNLTVYPQVELGSKPTPYEPYKSNKITIPFELASLPNGVKDTIEYIGNDKGRLTQRIGSVVFNGTQSVAETVNVLTKTREIRYKPTNFKPGGAMICNKFKVVALTWGIDTAYISSVAGNHKSNMAFRLPIGIEANTFFATNPVTVQYELATPIITEIDLPLLTSYKGVTNVFTTANPQVNLTANFKSELWYDRYLRELGLKALQDGKIDKTSIVQTDIVNDATKIPSSVVTNALGKEIDVLTNNLSNKARTINLTDAYLAYNSTEDRFEIYFKHPEKKEAVLWFNSTNIGYYEYDGIKWSSKWIK